MTVNERHFPWLRESFPTHQTYAKSDLPRLLGDRLKSSRIVEVDHLSSTCFLNRLGRWEARALPREAQWTPAMGLASGDFDGDGHEDVFVSQNFFSVRPEDGRLDAGRGLLLRGDGVGGFTAVSGQESGIIAYGQQGACATADYDGDGRLDLAVAQNSDSLRLYQNVRARPGLRVRLVGPPQNRMAIGAQCRLMNATWRGPVREVQAGGGCWAQNAVVQVLSTAVDPNRIELRWPGGSTITHPIPPEAGSVIVHFDGRIEWEPR
jgi:hypothetical protein